MMDPEGSNESVVFAFVSRLLKLSSDAEKVMYANSLTTRMEELLKEVRHFRTRAYLLLTYNLVGRVEAAIYRIYQRRGGVR